MNRRLDVFMIFKRTLSRILQSLIPELWQRLKYREYVTFGQGEREIRIIHHFVDPNRAALDVGVHIGMYTRHLARYSRSVIGFEANPDSAAFAKRSLSRIATIEWVALSSKQGTSILRVPFDNAGDEESALGTLSPLNALGHRPYREIRVPSRRLDDFELPPVGFIKIDVEGLEEEVIRGAEKLLRRDKPVLMIEIEERHNLGGLARLASYFLNHMSYRAAFFDGIEMHDISEFDTQRYQSANSKIYVNNFFFLPPGSKLCRI